MNLAVLVADYQTYEFGGAALNYFPRCNGCDADSLPFTVEYNPPGDFGSIAFVYTETGDTLLYGTIVWLGRGALSVPGNFRPHGDFGEEEEAAGEPESREYFDQQSFLDPGDFRARTDTAWAQVERLDIVRDFAQEHYRAGFLLYAPAVGPFVPAEARWIIFLYRNG
jgi:hypothetical protein